MKKITLKYFTILCGLLLMQPVLFGQSEPLSLMGRAPESLHDAYLASNPQPESFSFAPGDVQALDLFNGGIYGNFPLVGPYVINEVNILAEAVFAADFDNNDVLYGLDFDTNSLITVDIVDGTTAVVGPLAGLNTGHTVTGLAWNSANSTMYALSTDGTTTTLYTVDLTTGAMTVIGNTGNTLGIWIAIDNAGVCYMADIGDDQLYSIDLVSAVATAIGPLGIDISFAQEADVDPATNQLYMAGYLVSGDSNVYTVDVTTGAATLQGTTNGGELGIFAIEGQAVLNDDPETAATLVVGEVFEDNPVIADNTEATATVIDDPSCGNFTEADLWYSFVVPDSGSVSVESQEDDGSITDTAISIYEGEVGALVEVTCNDDGGVGLFSLAEVEGRTPGETLYARVWEWNGGSLGTFQMSAYDTPPPVNDDPEGAIALTVGSVFTDFPVTATNVSATDTAIDDPSCGNYGGADVWFTVVVPSTGQLVIETDTAGGITDTGMSIYTGEIGALVEVDCDDDDGNGLFSLNDLVDQEGGATLYIRVWEWGGGGFGPFQVAAYSDCAVNGGEIALTNNGATEVSLCLDGGADAVDVTLSGMVTGMNSQWVITDTAGIILDLPAPPPFDLTGLGVGDFLVWHLSFDDGLTGAAVGESAGDLMGCFDLSNPIAVELVEEGGVCEVCEYTLEMNDSFGDGWNGAIMDVLVDGVVVLDDVGLDDDPNNDGVQGFLSFPVNSTADVTTVFVDGGGFPGEVSYRIIDVNGFEVGAGNVDINIETGTITADCPSCVGPQNLMAGNFMPGTVDISWDGVDGVLGYIWEIQDLGVPQGDPGAIDSGSTLDMTSDTAVGAFISGNFYTLYVQSFCTVDDSSVFIPFDFRFLLPPLNDDCEDAIALECGTTVTGNTILATDSGSNPAPDVFYTYTGTGNESITLSLCDGGTDFDSFLRVFDDECNLVNQIAANDDTCGLQSELTFISDGVTTYTIMVEGFGSNSGVYSLAVTCEALPDCLQPTDLTAINVTDVSADLSWTDLNNPDAMSYDVEWGLQGFTVGTGTVEAGVANPFTLDALTANTVYDFYVTANCTEDESSEISGPATFTTTPEQAPPGECEYTLQMIDSFGDGWNGALLNVFRNGQVVLFEVSLDDDPGNDGALGSLPFEIIPGDDITTQLVNGGGFPGEISYNILDIDGATILASGDAANDITSGTLTASCTLSVGDNTLEDFSFYPNPAQDVINLDARTGIENVSIFNMLGQKVLEQKVDGLTAYQLNVSTMAKGAYLMQVTSNGKVGVYRVMKR